MTHQAAALLRDFGAPAPAVAEAAEPKVVQAFEPLLPSRRKSTASESFAPMTPSGLAAAPSGDSAGPVADGDQVAPFKPAAAAGPAALHAMLEDAFAGPGTGDQQAGAGHPVDAPPAIDEGAQLAAALDQVRALERRIHELEAQKEAVTAAHAGQIASIVNEMLPAIAGHLTDAMGAQLAPVLAHGAFEAAKTEAITQFVEDVAAELLKGQGASIRLTVPGDLVDAVRKAWPDDLPPVTIETAERLELSADLDGVVIETRLAKLRSALLGEGQ